MFHMSVSDLEGEFSILAKDKGLARRSHETGFPLKCRTL